MDEETLTPELLDQLISGMGDKTKALLENQIEPLKKTLEEQGVELKRLKAGEVPDGPKSVKSIIDGNKKGFQSVIDGSARSVKFTVPEVSVKTLVETSAVGGSTIAQRLPDVGQVATMPALIRSLFRTGTVSQGRGGVIKYVDQKGIEISRGAAFRAEGQQKPESAIEWEEKSLILRKIADSIPVTKEALEDFDFMQSEIERLLTQNLALKIDQALWDADGTPPEVEGIFEIAEQFVFTGTPIEDPTFFDLILAMKAQMVATSGSKFNPNTIVVNPMDVLSYKLEKLIDGRYKLPLFLNDFSFDQILGGMRLIESGQVDQGTMLVGDFRYATLYSMGGTEIQIGHIDKQFVENTVTILAEERLGLLVRSVDVGAFQKVTNIEEALYLLAGNS